MPQYQHTIRMTETLPCPARPPARCFPSRLHHDGPRALSLSMEKIKSIGTVTEDVALTLVDSVMSIAIDLLQTGQKLHNNNSEITVQYLKSET